MPDQAPPSLVGQRIGGRYVLDVALGRGGMGEVYAALDEKLGRRVAVKMLSSVAAPTRDAVDRLLREAKTAAALNHPGIVGPYLDPAAGGETAGPI